MERVFAGVSDVWEQTSIPTMVEAEGKVTYGFCVALTEAQYTKIANYEKMSEESMVSMTTKDGGDQLDALCFVHKDLERFVYPSFGLLEAVARTDAAYYYNDESDIAQNTYIEVAIINGTNNQEEGVEKIDLRTPIHIPPSTQKTPLKKPQSSKQRKVDVTDFQPLKFNPQGTSYLK